MKRKPKLDFYQDKQDFWRWRALAANGRTVADSSEGYVKLADCERGAHITCQAILAHSQPPPSNTIN